MFPLEIQGAEEVPRHISGNIIIYNPLGLKSRPHLRSDWVLPNLSPNQKKVGARLFFPTDFECHFLKVQSNLWGGKV